MTGVVDESGMVGDCADTDETPSESAVTDDDSEDDADVSMPPSEDPGQAMLDDGGAKTVSAELTAAEDTGQAMLDDGGAKTVSAELTAAEDPGQAMLDDGRAKTVSAELPAAAEAENILAGSTPRETAVTGASGRTEGDAAMATDSSGRDNVHESSPPSTHLASSDDEADVDHSDGNDYIVRTPPSERAVTNVDERDNIDMTHTHGQIMVAGDNRRDDIGPDHAAAGPPVIDVSSKDTESVSSASQTAATGGDRVDERDNIDMTHTHGQTMVAGDNRRDDIGPDHAAAGPPVIDVSSRDTESVSSASQTAATGGDRVDERDNIDMTHTHGQTMVAGENRRDDIGPDHAAAGPPVIDVSSRDTESVSSASQTAATGGDRVDERDNIDMTHTHGQTMVAGENRRDDIGPDHAAAGPPVIDVSSRDTESVSSASQTAATGGDRVDERDNIDMTHAHAQTMVAGDNRRDDIGPDYAAAGPPVIRCQQH